MLVWTFVSKLFPGETMQITSPDPAQPFVAARLWRLVSCEAGA